MTAALASRLGIAPSSSVAFTGQPTRATALALDSPSPTRSFGRPEASGASVRPIWVARRTWRCPGAGQREQEAQTTRENHPSLPFSTALRRRRLLSAECCPGGASIRSNPTVGTSQLFASCWRKRPNVPLEGLSTPPVSKFAKPALVRPGRPAFVVMGFGRGERGEPCHPTRFTTGSIASSAITGFRSQEPNPARHGLPTGDPEPLR